MWASAGFVEIAAKVAAQEAARSREQHTLRAMATAGTAQRCGSQGGPRHAQAQAQAAAITAADSRGSLECRTTSRGGSQCSAHVWLASHSWPVFEKPAAGDQQHSLGSSSAGTPWRRAGAATAAAQEEHSADVVGLAC